MILLVYNFVWILFFPIMLMLLVWRIIVRREDILRIKERFGFPSSVLATHGVIWIHAASVGESRIALNLTKQLHKIYPKKRVLITTGTVTSAKIVRASASARIIHQFLPMDNPISVWLFFRYWRPDIGIFIESELWPNLINIGSNFCPLILVNARMSDRSFTKWKRYSFVVRAMLSRFKHVLCQSKIDAEKYQYLGINSLYVGNLKYASEPLEVRLEQFKKLQTMTKDRLIFLAASTHPGDEDIILDAYKQCKSKYSNLLVIIAPRHVIRSSQIKDIVLNKNLKCSVRSLKENIKDSTDIYIADTMGELGMFFKLANISFIGGSFENGGHNPIEAAYFDTQIMFGPDMTNFTEVANEFIQNNAAIQIKDPKDLVKLLERLLGSDLTKNKAASAILKNHANVMTQYIQYIQKHMTSD